MPQSCAHCGHRLREEESQETWGGCANCGRPLREPTSWGSVIAFRIADVLVSILLMVLVCIPIAFVIVAALLIAYCLVTRNFFSWECYGAYVSVLFLPSVFAAVSYLCPLPSGRYVRIDLDESERRSYRSKHFLKLVAKSLVPLAVWQLLLDPDVATRWAILLTWAFWIPLVALPLAEWDSRTDWEEWDSDSGAAPEG
jgi:hypothetical protein